MSFGVGPFGICQRCSPLFMSIAVMRPYGGLISGSPSAAAAPRRRPRCSGMSEKSGSGLQRATLGCVYEPTYSMLVSGSNAPPSQFAPPVKLRQHERAARAVGRVRKRRRREDRAHAELLHALERLGVQRGREVDQVVLGDALAIERGRLRRERLRRRRPLARHVATCARAVPRSATRACRSSRSNV